MRCRLNQPTAACGRQLAGPEETFTEAVDERAIGRRQSVKEAVDRFDNDAPLRETGDRAERIQARLHFDRHADAKLRVVFDLLAFPGTGRRTAGAATFSQSFVLRVRTFVSHRRTGRRGTAEIRTLHRASDTC